MSCKPQPVARRGVASHWPGAKATYVGKSHSSHLATVAGIRAYHKRNGYCDIAYNLVVCPCGKVINGRGAGIQSGANGSTSANVNYGSVLWLVGPGEAPTEGQAAAYQAAYRMLGGGEHKTHNDVRPEPTACPGPAVTAYINTLNDPTPPPVYEPPTAEDDEDMTLIEAPASSGGYAWWMLQDGHLCSITAGTAANARAGGIKAFRVDSASWANIVRTYPTA